MRSTCRALGAIALLSASCSADAGGSGGPSVPPSSPFVPGASTHDAATPTPVIPPPAPGETCERVTVAASPEIPNVMIVLDRSGSMYDFEDGGENVDRWSPSVSAIESVTATLDDRVAFGLMLFSSDDDCGVGYVELPPSTGNAASLRSALAGDPYDMTGGGTPTAATLYAARDALASRPGRSVVLLVTDGAPNCNYDLDDTTCRCTTTYGCEDEPSDCLDDANAVAAVRALREAGISTFVVGYDTGMWADVMDRMAMEGGTGMARHLAVTDRTSLEGALASIGGTVASCAYELGAAPGDVRYVRVTVDGTMVEHTSVRSDGNGWQLDGAQTVTLVGSACDRVRDGVSHTIDVVVECTPVIF